MSYSLHNLPEGERPRERFLSVGARGLSSAELIALILRTGRKGEPVVRLAERILAEFRGLPGVARATVAELQTIDGIGPAKAIEIKSALELGRRLMAAAPHERPQIKAPGDAAGLLMSEMAHLEQEHLRVILLDTKNRVMSVPNIYVGSVNMSLVRIGEIFKQAIRENATSVIVAHNHPSGDPTPSPEDIRLTRELVKAGKLLSIEVLDHVVIGRNRYVSLKERGLGF